MRGWKCDIAVKANLVLVDGSPGVLVTVGGRPVTVMAFTVGNGTVTAIHALKAPTRLGQSVPRSRCWGRTRWSTRLSLYSPQHQKG